MFSPRCLRVPFTCARNRTPGGARQCTNTSDEPLRILFCGADDFSITSLEALYKEHQANDHLIESIDVVCRPPKRTGRGLKTLRHAPIKAAAQQLEVPVHELDTFRHWSPPRQKSGPPNLIVAVSFGLFIPKRILDSTRWGGVNVHPSLLPDLRGPAPIQHAIIKDREQFGVTIQTLSDEHFDRGRILAQTLLDVALPHPTFRHDQGGVLARTVGHDLARAGALTLVETLKKALYLNRGDHEPSQYHSDGTQLRLLPHRESWPQEPHLTHPEHAPKITKEDCRIDWATFGWRALALRHGALGQLWDDTTYRQCHSGAESKRIIFQELEPMDVETSSPGAVEQLNRQPDMRTPGRPSLFLESADGDGRPRYVPCSLAPDSTLKEQAGSDAHADVVVGIATCDAEVPFLCIKHCTVESGARGKGQQELTRMLLELQSGKHPAQQ